MSLTERQRKHLRRLAHVLGPVVLIGTAGASDAVAAELDRALTAHELVKVSARIGDRQRRAQALAALAARTASELVQCIGNVGVYYRRGPGLPKVVVPDE